MSRSYLLSIVNFLVYIASIMFLFISFAVIFSIFMVVLLFNMLLLLLFLSCLVSPFSSHSAIFYSFNPSYFPLCRLCYIPAVVCVCSACVFLRNSQPLLYSSSIFLMPRAPSSSFNLLDLLSLQPFSVLFYLSCSIYFLILAGIFPIAIFYSKLFYVLFLSSASLFLTFALSFIMFFMFSFAFISLICNLF